MGLRSEAPVSAPLPTLESLLEPREENATSEEAKAPESKEDQGTLERIEREQKHRREMLAAQKRIKDLESKQRDPSDKTSGIESKNPIRDIAKAKNLSQDDVIRMALEAMDDDLTPEEKKNDLKKMDPTEIAKLVKEELDKERQTAETKTKQTEAITNFKTQISEKAKELAEQYPMVDALGGANNAFDMINSQYEADLKEFGDEYAQENMMKIEDAIKKTNEILANNVKDALKSKHLRDFIIKAIKEDGFDDKDFSQSKGNNQLNEENVTMTNKSHRAATEASGKPNFSSDADELDFLINKLI